jgi:hypothetical protein
MASTLAEVKQQQVMLMINCMRQRRSRDSRSPDPASQGSELAVQESHTPLAAQGTVARSRRHIGLIAHGVMCRTRPFNVPDQVLKVGHTLSDIERFHLSIKGGDQAAGSKVLRCPNECVETARCRIHDLLHRKPVPLEMSCPNLGRFATPSCSEGTKDVCI